jgi:general secretion pathway protein N
MNLRVARGLTLGLAGICALLFLLLVMFWFGVGRGYSWWQLDPADEAAGKKKPVNSQFRLGPWDNFAEVNTRPLFNEDRRPTPPMPPDAQAPATPIPKLDVVLSGVIITSKMRLALVKEKGKEKSMTVKEGGAMPGEWAAWSLAEVKPRSAVFKNSAGESATVELIAVANSQKPTPPPPPRLPQPAPATPPVAGQAPPAGQPPQIPPAPAQSGAPDATATDLQQRIDARRQQIREQQQQQQAPQPAPPQPAAQQQQ